MLLPAPWLLALALAIGLIVALPARRLYLGGVPSRVIGAYALVLWLLAMAMAVRPVASRLLIPFLIVLYLAPFVAGPERLRRLLPRGGGRPPSAGRPPMKDVTPPDQRVER